MLTQSAFLLKEIAQVTGLIVSNFVAIQYGQLHYSYASKKGWGCALALHGNIFQSCSGQWFVNEAMDRFKYQELQAVLFGRQCICTGYHKMCVLIVLSNVALIAFQVERKHSTYKTTSLVSPRKMSPGKEVSMLYSMCLPDNVEGRMKKKKLHQNHFL